MNSFPMIFFSHKSPVLIIIILRQDANTYHSMEHKGNNEEITIEQINEMIKDSKFQIGEAVKGDNKRLHRILSYMINEGNNNLTQ